MKQAQKYHDSVELQARRDLSTRGIAKRAQFKASLDLLRQLEFSDEALTHYQRLARKTRKLPHILVRDVAEGAIMALVGVPLITR